jgi:2-methylcitrate dehydratase PrpD
MILRSWAEALSNAAGPAEIIDLHVQDSVVAFHAGIATQDGQALARLFRSDISALAAAVAAIARASECDDIHLPSCVTPGAAIIPVALAFAKNRTDADVRRAIAAGCAAGLTLGLAIGGAKALANGVWPTLLAAPLMAAVTASHLFGHRSERLAHAMALALAGSSGRIGRPVGTPSGRWFAFAQAIARGIRAADAAGLGFSGDLTLLSKEWLAREAGHDGIDMGALESSALSISEVGFKPFPIARQAANAVVAFQRLLSASLDPRRVDSIAIFVPAINVALLSRPLANDRLGRLSNIGFQIACAALAPDMLYDAERASADSAPLLEFARRVSLSAGPDLEAHLPGCWPARVLVNAGGERFEETVINAPFDHDAAGLPALLRAKWQRLPGGRAQGFTDFVTNVSDRYSMVWQDIERRLGLL